jgi:hypothetical protein
VGFRWRATLARVFCKSDVLFMDFYRVNSAFARAPMLGEGGCAPLHHDDDPPRLHGEEIGTPPDAAAMRSVEEDAFAALGA